MSRSALRSLAGGVWVLVYLCCGSTTSAQAVTAQSDPASRFEVADLVIHGVRAVEESELRAALETRENPWLPWRDSEYFDSEAFKQDLERIEEFYTERGYPHARVIESEVERRGDEVAVRIVVAEGEPLRVDEVTFTGFDVMAESRLRALREAAPLEAGEPLAIEELRSTAQLAANILGNAGYAYSRIEALQTTVASNLVCVELHAEPGARGTFGAIEIAGNASIEDPIIRRELTYRPGEPFTAAALRASQLRLLRLGLFESVLVEVANPDSPQADVPTRVTVKEADLNQFGYSFGYGTEEQVNVEAQWRRLNLLGGGRTGTIRGRWSSIDRGAEGLFVQPYLFAPTLTLQLNANAWQFDEPVYTMTSRGGSSSLSYSLGPLNILTGTYLHQYESTRIATAALADGGTLLTALGLDPSDGSRDGLLSALRFDASRDTTVDPVSPRTGYRAFGRIEKAGGWLPGSFTYRNIFMMGRYYRPLGPLTVAGRLQFGSIAADEDEGLPFSKRYFLGALTR